MLAVSQECKFQNDVKVVGMYSPRWSSDMLLVYHYFDGVGTNRPTKLPSRQDFHSRWWWLIDVDSFAEYIVVYEARLNPLAQADFLKETPVCCVIGMGANSPGWISSPTIRQYPTISTAAERKCKVWLTFCFGMRASASSSIHHFPFINLFRIQQHPHPTNKLQSHSTPT